MDAIDLQTPLAGLTWPVSPGTALTVLIGPAVEGDTGVIIAVGGTVEITYAEGVRTDPARPPRTLNATGSVLAYAVLREPDGSLVYRFATNRAGG
jgi:hypothetical protein